MKQFNKFAHFGPKDEILNDKLDMAINKWRATVDSKKPRERERYCRQSKTICTRHKYVKGQVGIVGYMYFPKLIRWLVRFAP
jgi:hypothetical protein